MIIGSLSDSHSDRMKALPHIISVFTKANVELIIHCGDIHPEHVNAKLFADLPVICALNEREKDAQEFIKRKPLNWTFTYPCEPADNPANRIVDLESLGFGREKVYVGHKRSFDFLLDSKEHLEKIMQQIRIDYDGIRLLFSGHVHHQTFDQGNLISYVNPGAVEDSFDGYEYAIIDTEKNDILFSRIAYEPSNKTPLNVAIVSDSADVSINAPSFWQNLVETLKSLNVTHVIHCGNIDAADIQDNVLPDFQVHAYIIPQDRESVKVVPDNWKIYDYDDPVLEMKGYKFLIDYDFGATIMKKTGEDLMDLELEIRSKHPRLDYVLYGLTYDAFYEEGRQLRYVNPGDVIRDRNFAIIKLPQNEIIFSHIPKQPLLQLAA